MRLLKSIIVMLVLVFSSKYILETYGIEPTPVSIIIILSMACEKYILN